MSNKLERLIKTLRSITDNEYPTVESLCMIYEVSERTIYDDLRAIKEKLGIDIEFDKKKNGYKLISSNPKLPDFEITQKEFFELALGNFLANNLASGVLKRDLDVIFNKIKSRLSEKITLNIEDLEKIISINSTPSNQINHKIFKTIFEACNNLKQIEIDYYSIYNDAITTRIINPLKLQPFKGSWYVIGYCNLKNDLRKFAIHRIKKHKVLKADFKPLDKNVLDNWLKTQFEFESDSRVYHFKIAFKDIAARYIQERKFHETQVLSKTADNVLLLEFEAQNLDEVKRFVLSWGPNAKVLEPKELVDKLTSELNQILQNYRGG